jgi:hypothetical protein
MAIGSEPQMAELVKSRGLIAVAAWPAPSNSRQRKEHATGPILEYDKSQAVAKPAGVMGGVAVADNHRFRLARRTGGKRQVSRVGAAQPASARQETDAAARVRSCTDIDMMRRIPPWLA